MSAPALKPVAPAPPPARRGLRIVTGIVLGLMVLFTVLLIVVLYALGHLDSAPIKSRVQAAAHNAGIDIDYAQAGVSLFSGLSLKDVRVLSAPEDRALAPQLARIGELHAGWSLGGLLGGTVDDLTLRDLTVTALQDEKGETSLDRFLAYKARLSPPGPLPEPGPVVPLSKKLASLLPSSAVAVKAITVEGVSARLIKTKDGKPSEQLRFGSLGLTGHASAGAGKLDLLLDLGTEAKPLAIEVAQEQVDGNGAPVSGTSKLLTSSPWIQLKGDANGVELSFAVPVEKRDLAPSLPVGALAKGHVKVAFDPAQSNTAVTMDSLSLVDGAATASANVDLKDTPSGGARPMVRKAQAHADLDRLIAKLKDLMPPGVDLKGGAFDLNAAELGMLSSNETPWLPGAPVVIGQGGSLNVDLLVDSVDLKSDQSQTHVRKTALKVRGTPAQIDVTTNVDKVALGELARPETEVEAVALKATVKPQSDGRLALQASVPVKHVAMHGASQIEARDVELGLDGVLRELKHFDGQITTSVQTARYTKKGQDVQARGTKLALKLDGADYNTDEPAKSSAGVGVTASIADATVRMAKRTIRAAGLSMDVGTKVAEGEPQNISLQLPIERLSIEGGPADPRLTESKLILEMKADGIVIDHAHSDRSLAHIVSELSLGALHITADVDKKADAVQFDISGGAERLGALAGLARGSASAQDRAMIEQLGVELQTKGMAEHLSRTADLLVNHQTKIVLKRPSAHREELDFAAKEVALSLTSRGGMQKHTFDLKVDLDSPRINRTGGEGHQTVALSGSFDMAHPHVDLHIAGSGVTGPEGKFDLSAGYDPATNVLDWTMDGQLAKFGLVGVVMPPSLAKKHQIDWEHLAFEAHGQGKHPTLVRKYKPGTPPSFEFVDDSLAAVRGTLKLDFTASGVDYKGTDEKTKEETILQSSSIALHANANVVNGRAHADAKIDIPSVHLQASGYKVDGKSLSPSVVVDTTGDRSNGDAKLNVAFTADSIEQNVEPGYSIGGVDLRVRARADTGGSIRLEKVSFDNKAGGTHLDLQGGMDLRPLDAASDTDANQVIARAVASNSIPGRKNLLIQGSLTQKLDALHLDPNQLSGKGTITVPFRIESGDLAYVHLSTAIRIRERDAVTVAMPKSGIWVTQLFGNMRVEQDLFIDKDRHVTPLAGATTSAYARARFADQQAFVSDDAFLKAQEIKIDLGEDAQHPDILALTNFFANVHVDRNLIAVDQTETDLAGGHLNGQVLIDYRGLDTSVGFHGSVTGLKTSHDDERLDANAAFTMKPYRRLLEGSIEVVHLGRGHLRTLLDWYDPYQTDSKANKARKGIAYGYPKQVRMGFRDGFASMFIDLGGVASAVQLGEITGVPVGPILERYLARRLRRKDEDL